MWCKLFKIRKLIFHVADPTREGERSEGSKQLYSPTATVHLRLLALSVVQEAGWHQGAQCDKCSRTMSEPTHTVPRHCKLQ